MSVVAIVASSLPASAPASATNFVGQSGAWGSCHLLNMADNKSHTWVNIDLEPYYANAIAWVRTNVIGPTVITNTTDTTPDSLTDVVVRDRYYVDHCGFEWYPKGENTIGLVECDSLSPSGRCEQHSLRLSNVWGDDQSTQNRTALACHEAGHTLGLAHRNVAGSCMQTPLVTTLNFSTHDIDHITANYSHL